jgi:hypothetical protein
MVVRIAYCKGGSPGSRFDEMRDRSARDMQYEDWAEFMVVWRNGRLELYDNYVSFFPVFCPPALMEGLRDCRVENGWQVTNISPLLCPWKALKQSFPFIPLRTCHSVSHVLQRPCV